MATERLPMRKTREILRLKWELRLSNRDAARSVGVSPGTIDNVLSRATKAGMTGWASVEPLSEAELEARLYQRPQVPVPTEERPEPDCAWIHRELRRAGVTLELLHHEYLEQHPNGLRYSAFCHRYRVFRERRRLSMRQHHVAGDKMFVDYSGKKPHLVNASTGELTEVELFVAVLGASNYTYAEATRTQQLRPRREGAHRGRLVVEVEVSRDQTRGRLWTEVLLPDGSGVVQYLSLEGEW